MLSDKESEALQEVAKTTGISVQAASAFGGFIAKCIGGPIEQAVGIWHDTLKYRRWENQVLLQQKAENFLRERGIDNPTRILDLSLVIPLLQEASFTDSGDLQDRWAMLLANAADAIDLKSGELMSVSWPK